MKDLMQMSLEAALTLHRQGRLNEAEQLYLGLLDKDAHDSQALYLLGMLALQSGNLQQSIDLFDRSLRVRPREAATHLGLGLAKRGFGLLEEALASFDEVLRIDPGHIQALNNKGLTLRELRRLEDALAAFDLAARQQPLSPAALFNRGNVLLELNRADEALSSYREQLRHMPDDVDTLITSAIALLKLKRPDEALKALDLALSHRPDSAAALMQRGIALTDLGRYEDALRNYESPLFQGSVYPEVCYQRAVACASMLNFDRAVEECGQALALRPEYREALFLAGMIADRCERPREAIAYFDRLLALAPDYPYARGARFHARARICDWVDAETERQRILAGVAQGDSVDAPFTFLAVSGSAALQLACARRFVADRYPPGPRAPSQAHDHGRIRVAYVSQDLRNHAVSRLMVRVFERHDRNRFEVSGISLHPEDRTEFGQRVRRAFEHFFDAHADADAQVCARLRAMQVDIAVDLTGFTEGARTRIFASRAAPLQMHYLGFPGTMGADYVDYLIADRFLVPPQKHADFAEKIIYVPDCFQANDDLRELPSAPSRTALGLPESGFVWCCLNSHSKINPETFDVWMRLLRRSPRSVLWLRDGGARTNLRREASARGVDPERLLFAPNLPYEANIARLRAASLCLDTTPFTGGASASDVLWAGVPLLTVAGDGYAARMAGSLLQAVGMPEMITDNLEQYERRALELVDSPALLDDLRTQLDTERRRSALFDSERFCRHLEAAYEHICERSRRGLAPASFAVSDVMDNGK